MSFGIKITPADRVFSLQIRSRDHWTCRRCEKVYVYPTNALQCAHMFSRRCSRCTAKRPRGQASPEHECTRLDPDNALALCAGCHTYLDSNPWEKEAFWRSEIGDERFDALAARAHGKRDR